MAISPTGWNVAALPGGSATPRRAPVASAGLPAPSLPQDAAVLEGAGESIRQRSTPSGIRLEEQGQATAIELPNGYRLRQTQDGPAVARDSTGRSFPVHTERDPDGTPSEFRFKTPQGTVRLDAANLTLTLTNPAETVTQSVEASGRHVIQCQSCFRDAQGKLSELVQSVCVEPDGLVRNLSRREGLEVSPQRVSFRNPLGCKLNFDLPLPLAQSPHGEWAATAAPASPAAAPAPTRAAVVPLGPLLME